MELMKRFTETDKWTQNKWFRKLEDQYKLFWLYMLDTCDSVGVWNEDVELAGLILSNEYNIKKVIEIFNGKIYIFDNEKKWWIKDFCNFQYGELNEDSNSKPIISYIKKLKYHRLWVLYTKGIYNLKEKEKDKEKEQDKEKEKDIEFIKEIISYLNQKLNSNYQYKAQIKYIKPRLKDGYKLEDFKKVINNKLKDKYFQDHPKYYAPKTLFSNKFDSYLNEKPTDKYGEYLDKEKYLEENAQKFKDRGHS